MEIAPGTRVTLHFAVGLADGQPLSGAESSADAAAAGTEDDAGGTIIDSNFGKAPATFTVGDGNLLPGFERVLLGLRAGTARRFVLAPADAFGSGHPDNVKMLPRSRFGAGVEPEPGLVVSFRSGDGELPGVVRSVEGELVVVDFNHPLAGRRVLFEVQIVDVVPV